MFLAARHPSPSWMTTGSPCARGPFDATSPRDAVMPRRIATTEGFFQVWRHHAKPMVLRVNRPSSSRAIAQNDFMAYM